MSAALALPALGVDLARYHHDVKRLAFAAVRGWLQRSGIDEEDYIQEVYRRILVRNAGKCPWDPSKGTLGHYVHRIARQTLATMTRDRRFKGRDRVHVGMRDPVDGTSCDARDVDQADPAAVTDEPLMLRAEAEALLERVPPRVRGLATLVLADRWEGRCGAETHRRHGASVQRVSRARGWLRRAAGGDVQREVAPVNEPVEVEPVHEPVEVEVEVEVAPVNEPWMGWGVDQW